MITGILNSIVQLDLSQTESDTFKVLAINYEKKEITLSMKSIEISGSYRRSRKPHKTS